MKKILQNQKYIQFVLRGIFLYYNRMIIFFAAIMLVFFLLNIKGSISLMTHITPGVIEITSVSPDEKSHNKNNIDFIHDTQGESFTGTLLVPSLATYNVGESISMYYNSRNPAQVVLDNRLTTIWKDSIITFLILSFFALLYFMTEYIYKKILGLIEALVKRGRNKFTS